MFYITILVCALIGAFAYGPLGILAGAVIGFLIVKIDGVISEIGRTDERISYDLFFKRLAIAVCICVAYGLFEAIRQ